MLLGQRYYETYFKITMEILSDKNLEELKAWNVMLNWVNRQWKGLPEFQKEYKNMPKLYL